MGDVMKPYYRADFFPHHDDVWVGDNHPTMYKGIPGAKMNDFLTHEDSRYDDVYSYFFEVSRDSDSPRWNDKTVVLDYMDYINYYYLREHDCVKSHHKGKCCYMCKHFVHNAKNKMFLGSCIYGLERNSFPRKHTGNYHAKHPYETCEHFEIREYYIEKHRRVMRGK